MVLAVLKSRYERSEVHENENSRIWKERIAVYLVREGGPLKIAN